MPLEYAGVLGQYYDSTLSFSKLEAARIASGLSTSRQQSTPAAATILVHPVRDGDAVEIEWRGTWYGGCLLERRDGQYYVSYDGYTSSWDEWVGPERLRLADAAKTPLLDVNAISGIQAIPGRTSNGTVQWKIGDVAWNTFTDEGKYYQVKLLANDGELWLCMDLKSLDFDWKKAQDLHADKPEQTFFPGK